MHIVSPPLPDIRTACGWSLHNPRLVVRAIELALNISGWPKYEISLYEELLSRIHINLSDTARMKLQALKSLDVSVIPLTEWHAFEAVATTIIDGVADTDDATIPSVVETILTLDLIQDIVPAYRLEAALSDEVKRYIGKVWKYHGYLYFPEDYEFLNGYVMCGTGEPEITTEQLAAYRFWLQMRRVVEQIPLVEEYRDTVFGVAAVRMYRLQYGRDFFREKGYVTPGILYENSGPGEDELEKLLPKKVGMLLRDKKRELEKEKEEPAVTYSQDMYDEPAYRGPQVPDE